MIKKVETSDNHRKLMIEALEKANLELVGLKDSNTFYESQIKHYVEVADRTKAKAQLAGEEAVKTYITDFHLTEEYQRFSIYWKKFSYTEIVERMEELYPKLSTIELIAEYLDEVPQTPAEETVEEDVDQDYTFEEKTSTQVAAEASDAEVSETQPPST